MTPPPLRWQQHVSSFQLAYQAFLRRFESYRHNPDDEGTQMALVQAFEVVFEIVWKTLKSRLEHEGFTDVATPRRALRQAFQLGWITAGDTWLHALEYRNLSVHTYHQDVLNQLTTFVREEFFPVLETFHDDFCGP
jgi:nucleotidyltransferase substrate binding protein (TIGR01987 family)